MATSKKYDEKETTSWHKIVCFGKTAELCIQYLAKGAQVLVEGEISYSEWTDKDGVKKYKTEIIAHNVQFLSAKGNAAGKSTEQPRAAINADDCAIPF